MLNIASFLTPLAARPDPNGAVANALHGRALEYNKTQEQNQLSEQTRHSKAEEGFQQGHLDLAKQEHADEMSNHERDLHTKLTEWAMGVLDKEGLDKAKEIAGPVLDAAGIGVDFGGGGQSQAQQVGKPQAPAPATPPADDDGFAKLQAVQAENAAKEGVPEAPGEPAASYGPRPGESMAQYVARGKAQAKAEEPAPTTQELDNEATEGPQKAGEEEAERSAQGEAPKWRLYNKRTGETYGLIDPAKVDAINQKRAYDRATAYATGTPEPGKPIVEEFLRGSRSEGDVETRMGHAEKLESELNKNQRVKDNHKGGPGGGLNPKLTGALTDDQEQHIQRSLTNAGVPKLNQAANDGEKVSMLAESKDPLQDKVAAGQMLKSLFGAAASEGERAFVFGSEGEFVRLQQMANNWLNGGEMPPQFAAAIRAASRRMAELARRKAHDVTERTISDVENDPIIGFHRMGLKTPEEFEARKKTLRDLGIAGEGTNPNDEASKLGF